MPKVTINLGGALRDVVGYASAQVEIADKTTFDEAIRLADSQYGGNLPHYLIDPDIGDIRQLVVIFVNKENLRHLDGLKTLLEDGDEIIILRGDMAGG